LLNFKNLTVIFIYFLICFLYNCQSFTLSFFLSIHYFFSFFSFILNKYKFILYINIITLYIRNICIFKKYIHINTTMHMFTLILLASMVTCIINFEIWSYFHNFIFKIRLEALKEKIYLYFTLLWLLNYIRLIILFFNLACNFIKWI